ncbi:MAG: hypothetical protein K2X32_04025 [Phycisphaerales bacterium]|nr:hypothetical protein [Phycisphaerales bacterium]
MRSMMTKRAASIGLLALVMGLGTCGAQAQVDLVWSQWPYVSQSGAPSISTPSRTMKTTDDFRLASGNGQAWNVWRIRATVLSLIGPSLSNYRVEVYADAGAAPGLLIHSQLATNAFDFGQSEGMRVYDLNFDMNLSLAAGTKYWVSVFGTTGITPQVMWAPSQSQTVNLSGSLFRDSAYGGSWGPLQGFGGAPRDMSMQVNAIQTVPGPAAAVVGGLGLLAAGARRRRVG